MRKSKTQKGITLIALIITIVVLLILAVVTIGAIKNDGLIQYAQNARKDYTDAANKEQEALNTLFDKIEGNVPGNSGESTGEEGSDSGSTGGENSDTGSSEEENLEPISKTETYIGYYADVDENGSVDGIIYADLAVDGSGQWCINDGTYSYSKKEILNNYYISQEKYKHKEFAEKPVIAPIDKVEENDRFYVMALEDFTTEDYTEFYWYYNAHGQMSDYATTTSVNFGKGKENTKKMMNKKYGKGLVVRDIWKYIGDEVSKGWFIPSRGEWNAWGVFAEGQGVTTKNYGNYGLNGEYWSSSQCDYERVWYAYMDYLMQSTDYMNFKWTGPEDGNDHGNSMCIRLSMTF